MANIDRIHRYGTLFYHKKYKSVKEVFFLLPTCTATSIVLTMLAGTPYDARLLSTILALKLMVSA